MDSKFVDLYTYYIYMIVYNRPWQNECVFIKELENRSFNKKLTRML